MAPPGRPLYGGGESRPSRPWPAPGERLGDELWRRLVGVAVVAGARLLLWEKALNAAGSPSGRARAEWD